MKLKSYQDFLDEIAKQNSCNNWQYFYEKNSRSARTIREAVTRAATLFADQAAGVALRSFKSEPFGVPTESNTVFARFRGKDESCGYRTGSEYILVLNGNSIERVDGSQPVVYNSVYSFVKNWQVIGK